MLTSEGDESVPLLTGADLTKYPNRQNRLNC